MSNQTTNVKIEDDPEKHRARHKELHTALDELFADYIEQHPEERKFTQMPLIKLINWSYEQTWKPTTKPK
jgi:hypothetical protein